MLTLSTLPAIGAAVTLSLGILGLVLPIRAARLIGLQPSHRLGISELRATYGGFFLTLGASALAIDATPVYAALGLAWLGTALARLVSIVLDSNALPINILAVLFEGGIAALCLSALTA